MQRRIFQIKDTVHQERWLLEIDDQFVTLKRYLYGLQREEIARGHSQLADKFPGYLDLPFEQWEALDTNEPSMHMIPNPTNDQAIERFNERLRERIATQPSNFFFEIHNRIAGLSETSDKEVFSPILGFLAKDEFDSDWETERFVPALKNIIRINFDITEVSIEVASEQYKHLEYNFERHLPALWKILRGEYDYAKENTDYGWYVLPEVKEDSDIQNLITFTNLGIGSSWFHIMGSCAWDDEHGFQISVNNDFKIEID